MSLHPMHMRVTRVILCGGLGWALTILVLPPRVWAQSEFINWQTKNVQRNLALERARVAPLEKTIQRLDRIGKSRGHEAQNMAVRVNTSYLSAQSIKPWLPSDSSSYEKLGSKTVESLSGMLKQRAKTVLTGGAAKFATGVSGVGTAGTVALEALDNIAKVVEYRQAMGRYRELKRIETAHQAHQVLASTFASQRRAELRGVQGRIAVLTRTMEGLKANAGEIRSAKGVRIHFDDRILARALNRFGDETTDADFVRIQQALSTATSAEQISAAFRTAANNEKARFIRETKKTVTVRNVVLVSLNAVARAAGGTPNKEVRELGGIARVYGFVRVPETRDVVLVGGVEPGVPPVGLDNLVTALKAVWKDGVVPTVSLDPDPTSPIAPQRVRVMGIPKATHFARIMLEADYEAKRIILGDPTVRVRIASLKTYRTLLPRRPGGLTRSRLWLTPAQPDEGEIQVSSTQDVVLFETGVRVLTERMHIVNNCSAGTGTTEPAAEEAVDSLTLHYARIEKQEPVFRQLHALFDLVLLSKILSQLEVDSPALEAVASLPRAAVKVPDTYPAVLTEFYDRNHRPIHLSGGVVTHSYLGARHRLHYDTVTMARLRRAARKLSDGTRIAARADGVILTLVVPKGRHPYFVEGLRALAAKKYRHAEGWLTRVIARDAFFGEAYVQRSQARAALGDLKGSRSDLERAIKLEPGDRFLRVIRFVLLMEMGMGVDQIKADTRTKSELADIIFERANAQNFMYRAPDAARASLDLVLKLNPRHADAYALRGWVRLLKRDFKAAYKDASMGVKLDPRSARSHSVRGAAGIALGPTDDEYYEDAYDDFTAAIKLAPEVPEWWYNRASVLNVWGNTIERDTDLARGHEAAIKRYTRLLKKRPDNAVLYVRRGEARVRAGEIKKAIEDYDAAIRKSPKMAPAYLKRASACHALERYADAARDAETAIGIDARYARAYAARGAASYKLGKPDAALHDCNKAIALDSKLAYAYHIRALVKEERGDRDGAIRDWEAAQKAAPARKGFYQQLIDHAKGRKPARR